jgi:hypothetical protein
MVEGIGKAAFVGVWKTPKFETESLTVFGASYKVRVRLTETVRGMVLQTKNENEEEETMSAIQEAIQAADKVLQTATYMAQQDAETVVQIAAAPIRAAADAKIAQLKADRDAAVATATAGVVGTDVVARLSGGRTRRATVKAVELCGDTLKYTLSVKSVFTADYEEVVYDSTDRRVVVPYTDEEFAASKAFKAALNASKARSPADAAFRAQKYETRAFAAFQAAQAAVAPVSA